jgi:protein gp37
VNKTKIEWTDYVWNPVRGCLHNCPYCYGKRIDRRFGDGSFTPTFHPERLQEPLKVKKPSRIFVGSMADLFGNWGWFDGETEIHPGDIIDAILNIAKQCPQHTFIFLTKNPKGMQGFDFPDNCWCGTSAENQEKYNERKPELLKVNCRTLFISYEPALGPIDFGQLSDFSGCQIHCPDTKATCRLHSWECKEAHDNYKKISWLIIGAQTGPGAVKPHHTWISGAISQARNANIPVFVKDNVNWFSKIQEWPEGVKSC